MSIVVWVPLTGLPSGLPALTGVASGTPLPANAIAEPEGYDPADPEGLWDLFPTDQPATYAQSYTPIAVATPFNISEAVQGVTLSGGTVQVLNYALSTAATPIEGVTLSGGTVTTQIIIEVPSATVVVGSIAPEVEGGAADVPLTATYSQSSVWYQNSAATAENMTNGTAAETMQTATDYDGSSVPNRAWVQMDFGVETAFSKVVVGRPIYGTLAGWWDPEFAYDADIIGSNDGTTWTVLNNTGIMTADVQEYLTPGASYRYVRVRSTANSGNWWFGALAITEFYALNSAYDIAEVLAPAVTVAVEGVAPEILA